MKVLFAVNNESISESITKKYQQEFKEIISVKNVYYFNAIIKELQRDKTYDRIVISEDLQPFSNNNYDQIDKFIFEKLDNISDEATNQNGNDIPIILITADRREKADPLLIKLFGIGVYNALIGKDRSITEVCQLLNRPRSKKEAKIYYNIDSEDVDYKGEKDGEVSEVEIQNILNHYKKLGKNEEQYVESFDHIAAQYTDAQLRLIAKFLPLNVKAVLEANSIKYQEIVSFGAPTKTTEYNQYYKNNKKDKERKQTEDTSNNLEIVQKNLKQNAITEPVIIPSAVNTQTIKKVQTTPKMVQQPTQNIVEEPVAAEQQSNNIIPDFDELFEEIKAEQTNNSAEKNIQQSENIENNTETLQPKRRGRPKKIKPENIEEEPKVKRGRGRPRKQENIENIETTKAQNEFETNENVLPQVETEETVNLFDLDDGETVNDTPEDMILPGLDDDFLFAQEENTVQEAETQNINSINLDIFNEQNENNVVNKETIAQQQATTTNQINQYDINSNYQPNEVAQTVVNNYDRPNIIGKNQKIVSFIGTSKNGTSFLVNNVAELLSQKGINTAILDLTKNKNSYYIYTENDEALRKIAFSCIDNLQNGIAKGIPVSKNLTVYTTVPTEKQESTNYYNILETLTKNHSLVILDCDFDTDFNYFGQSQEIYLVQSCDILTIQPLTAFLRNLKAKNVLDPNKIRVVLNKMVKLKSVNEKAIIGGMAYYNDPAMSFMTELFNKDNVKYCVIPFEEQTYSKYLDGIINCKVTLNGYSREFLSNLEELGNMVYPLIGANSRASVYNSYNRENNFSASMNNTLNKMKNNY